MLSGNEIKTLLMLQGRKDNLFSPLPKELIINKIGGLNAENALKSVIEADYKKLFFILSAYPHAMFEKTQAENIDGEIIERSPLEYALYYLDSFAWNICYNACRNNSFYLDQFKLQVYQAEDCIDLNVLNNAYVSYMDLFDQHKINLVPKSILLDAWLNVGVAQRKHLPRHMLIKMCMLSIGLQPATHDLILISFPPETIVDNKLLNEISHGSHHAILIKQNDSFIFCKFDFLKKHWSQTMRHRLPFKHLDFPEKFNEPIFKNHDSDTETNFQYEGGDYWNWVSIQSIIEDECYIQETVFANLENTFEKLFPLSAQLGTEFALARGGSCLCYAVDNPTGNSHSLKYKAADDLKAFKNLLRLGILEKEVLISKLKNNTEANLSISFSK